MTGLVLLYGRTYGFRPVALDDSPRDKSLTCIKERQLRTTLIWASGLATLHATGVT